MQHLRANSPMSNREMAKVLFNIASLLRRDGHRNLFRIEAYERGARALMALRRESAEILATEKKVPFAPERHIGVKLQRKIREMVAEGKLQQYAEMLEEQPEHLRELMTLPDMGPKMAERIYQTLGITTRAAAVQAARNGCLLQVPGFGMKRVAQIVRCERGEWVQLTLPGMEEDREIKKAA